MKDKRPYQKVRTLFIIRGTIEDGGFLMMPKWREYVMRGTTQWWSPYDVSIQKKYGVFLTLYIIRGREYVTEKIR